MVEKSRWYHYLNIHYEGKINMHYKMHPFKLGLTKHG